MKELFGYVRTYILSLSPVVFINSTVFIAVAVFCNYYFNINGYIRTLNQVQQYFAWFFLFLIVFASGYLFQVFELKSKPYANRNILCLLIAAPALFAWKMLGYFWFPFAVEHTENVYWNHVAFWPFKAIVITLFLWFIWKLFNKEQPFYGLITTGIYVRPYLLTLLLMLPLVLLAATQPDFLATYPKFLNIFYLKSNGKWFYKVLYELSYGTDFFTIELFFRGFLVLAFAKWVGKDAVLPMALFYCTIHFGKPLAECISSFFGGMILGAITLQTRNIWGGLIVHLGIAWMMEVFGFIALSY